MLSIYVSMSECVCVNILYIANFIWFVLLSRKDGSECGSCFAARCWGAHTSARRGAYLCQACTSSHWRYACVCLCVCMRACCAYMRVFIRVASQRAAEGLAQMLEEELISAKRAHQAPNVCGCVCVVSACVVCVRTCVCVPMHPLLSGVLCAEMKADMQSLHALAEQSAHELKSVSAKLTASERTSHTRMLSIHALMHSCTHAHMHSCTLPHKQHSQINTPFIYTQHTAHQRTSHSCTHALMHAQTTLTNKHAIHLHTQHTAHQRSHISYARTIHTHAYIQT